MSLPAHASPKDDDADPAGLVGRVLADRYRVTGLLGVGGIGRVYRAEHLVLRRQVALKVLLEHYQCVPELQRRFEREAMALAALAHPNIVTIIDFVSSRDATFLVMELLEGEELDALLSRGPLSARDAFAVMEQILSSLAYAHERDVIHRDLKPQNVIVRRLPGGRLHATMLDFGLAKFMDGSGPGQNLTKTGLVVGTPAYMAPEQASGAHADRRADVYAAGIMFFELLAGSHPFEGFEGTELLRQHLLAPPPSLASRCTGAKVARELEALLSRALAKDGADRYADAGAMLDAFLALPVDAFVPGDASRTRSAAEGETAHALTRPAVPAAVSASRAGQRRSRWKSALAAAVVLGCAAAAAVLLWPDTTPPAIDAADDPPADPGADEASADDAVDDAVGETDDEVATDEDLEAQADEEELEAQADEEAPVEENDPSLDEIADAPLEEDEEEVEPEPPPPRVRPAARNPWGGREPATLSLVRRRIARGQPITKRHMRQVAQYRRRNPSDVRATLVLAQAYASRGWLSSALSQYRRAYRRQPSSRGDPRMQRDLIRMAGTESLHADASSAIVEIYGAEIVPALERAIARERDGAVRARLEAALARARAGP